MPAVDDFAFKCVQRVLDDRFFDLGRGFLVDLIFDEDRRLQFFGENFLDELNAILLF